MVTITHGTLHIGRNGLGLSVGYSLGCVGLWYFGRRTSWAIDAFRRPYWGMFIRLHNFTMRIRIRIRRKSWQIRRCF